MNTARNYFPGIHISSGLDAAHHHETFSIHTHTKAEIFCFIAGKAIYHVEGSEYPLSPGDILLMRPTEAHFIETDPRYDYERVIVSFEPSLLQELDPNSTLTRPLFDRKSGKQNHYRATDFETDAYMKHLRNMLHANSDRLTVLADLILLMKELCIVFDRSTQIANQMDTVEYQIIRHINKNLSTELTLKELCDAFFLSRSQLCLRFKNATGISVGKYISRKRLILARQKILQGQKPTDIFSECGYQDYSTFYRAYTRFFGHSPKQESEGFPVNPETDRIDLF